MVKGKNIYIREFEPGDFDSVWEWRNDSNTTLYASSNAFDMASKEQLINGYKNNPYRKNYAVCTDNDELIGEVSYWVTNPLFRSTVELGIIIGKNEHRNMGYGIEVTILVGNVIFSDMKIHRITICIGEHNHLIRVPLEKTGLRLEGKIRKDRFIDNRYYDSLIYGILRDEFYIIRDRCSFLFN